MLNEQSYDAAFALAQTVKALSPRHILQSNSFWGWFVEQFWLSEGYVLRQPVVAPRGDTRDFTWIATELARRTGLLEAYNVAINRGSCGARLKGPLGDFSLDTARVNSVDEILNADCKAASCELTAGRETHDLDWFKQHGLLMRPCPQSCWYLYPTIKRLGLHFELPYQERLTRAGRQLGARLHKSGIRSNRSMPTRWGDRKVCTPQCPRGR